MSANGWIKIHRKAFKHKFWTKARVLSEFEAWIDLLQSARFDETDEIRYIDGLEVKCGHAQYPASIRFLSWKWQWGEQKVRSFLNQLKKDGSIAIDCSQGISIITICKYDNYNSPSNINNTGYNTPDNTDINLLIKEIQALKTQLATQEITHPQHTPNTNKKKDKKDNNIISPPIIPQQGETVATAPDASDEPEGKKEKTWREDYEIYLNLVREAYRAIRDDPELINRQQTFHPGVDIMLSIEKACENFWATEAGWKHKKKSRAKEINLKMTLINAIDKNRVFKSNETTQKQTKRYDDGDFLQ